MSVRLNGFKILFSQLETCFSQFIDKFLKLEKTVYVIHHAKFEMWPALCELPHLIFNSIYLLVLACLGVYWVSWFCGPSLCIETSQLIPNNN